jgi:P27 family predicted phage terminase small subunit
MRGRKPTSNECKVFAGERRDRLNLDAPPPLSGRPDKPRHLDADASKEWDRLIPLLEEGKLLSRAESGLLELYCSTYSLWVQARKKLEAEGMVVATPSGGVKASPYIAIASACVNQLGRLLVEFGLTPSARSRLKLGGGSEAPKDDMDEFIARKKDVG